MEGEQTWPTDEEIADAEMSVMGSRRNRGMNGFDEDQEGDDDHGSVKNGKRGKKTIRVPKGTSAYQAAWIVDDVEEDVEEGEDKEDSDDGDDMDGIENDADLAGEKDDYEENEDNQDEEYEDIDTEEKIDDFDVDFNPADDDRQLSILLS
jgi:pre-rRNA-processing protein TSR1